MKKKLTAVQLRDRAEDARRSYVKCTESLFGEIVLLIPDNEEGCNEGYPGGILPGRYTMGQVVEMLRLYKDNPDAIEFIADMLE